MTFDWYFQSASPNLMMLEALENIFRLTAAGFLVCGEFPKIWTWLAALINFGAAQDAVQHGLGSFAKSVSS